MESFRCQSMSTGRYQSSNYAGKIILPQSALAKLSSLHIAYPMLFELNNDSADRFTHAGVLEFTAPEGRIFIPEWMMRQLEVHDGDIINVKSTALPLGTFLKIQPQSVDFLDISDPKAVLENALRQYAALTQGAIIAIKYNNKVYELLCMEIKPDTNAHKGITIIETDLSVDFAAPLNYVEPERTRHDSTTSRVSQMSEISVDEHKLVENKWQAFSGSGQRLSGKSLTAKSAIKPEISPLRNVDIGNVPEALRIPKNKLWFGYEMRPYVTKSPQAPKPPLFEGSGQSLRR